MSINQKNLYGVVVWYNPTDKNVTLLQTYINEIQTLFVVDNSDSDNSALLNSFSSDKFLYLPNFKNLGIATALNIGCREAIKHGAKWILTMDQDSSFDSFSISEYLKEANTYISSIPVGIFSAIHNCGEKRKKSRPRFQENSIVMTSGNLLSVEAFLTCGEFRDEFFIDLVDDEYCCRLLQNNFQVVQLNRLELTHHLGDGQIPVFFFCRKTFVRHAAVRYFYMIRNSLKMRDLYPARKSYYNRLCRKRIKRCLLYDFDHKGTKLKYMYKGWCAYRKNQFGSFSDE